MFLIVPYEYLYLILFSEILLIIYEVTKKRI